MYTGFIAEVVGRKTPRDAAVDALERGGLRLGREEGFVSRGEERLAERGRFRFAGWLDVPVVEHEFTLRLGDGVTLEERFPPRVHDGDADEGTRETFDPRIDASALVRDERDSVRRDARGRSRLVPDGFGVGDGRGGGSRQGGSWWRLSANDGGRPLRLRRSRRAAGTPRGYRRDGCVLVTGAKRTEGASDSGGYLRGPMTPQLMMLGGTRRYDEFRDVSERGVYTDRGWSDASYATTVVLISRLCFFARRRSFTRCPPRRR